MKPVALLTLAALLATTLAARADVVRTPSPIRPSRSRWRCRSRPPPRPTYVSGQVPPVVNKDADPASPQAYGDVKTQTVGVLNRIKGILEGLGLGMGDVVKMQVFLVHDARAPMDFKGFMEGYTQFFGGSAAQSAGAHHGRRRVAGQSRISGRDRSRRRQGRQIGRAKCSENLVVTHCAGVFAPRSSQP